MSWAIGKTAHDLWYEAFGKAFLGNPEKVQQGRCEACLQQRSDVMNKGRMICVRCASMSMKKPKVKGGISGPQALQIVLVRPEQAIYTAGQLVVPSNLPKASQVIDVFGDLLLAQTLYAPPEPPFLLLRLDRNSDPVLNEGKVTRSLSRMYVGSVKCIQINQPHLRKAADVLRAVSETPEKLIYTLARMQPTLFRGPTWHQQRFNTVAENREMLARLDPAFDEVFPESGDWLIKPNTPVWDMLALVVRNKGWEQPPND